MEPIHRVAWVLSDGSVGSSTAATREKAIEMFDSYVLDSDCLFVTVLERIGAEVGPIKQFCRNP